MTVLSVDYFTGYRDAGRERRTFIRLILQRDPYRNRSHALEARGRFKVGALLTAMQLGRAFWAGSVKHGAGRQRGGATVTAGRRYGLNKPWQPWASDIQ